ncbi:TRAP transporter large permease [Thermodesulfobacteriota bacterium]
MSDIQIGILAVVLLFIMMILRTPVGVAMGVSGLLGIGMMTGLESAFSKLALTPYTHSNSYVLAVIPLFLFMGELAFVSGITKEAYYTVNKWVGHLPGGLAMASVGGCAGFAAVCGSSSATAVTMVSVALPEMRARKYDNGLALGSIAAGGTLGILIPPSAAFILYGIITEQSIGKLFLSGIIPGILLTALFMIFIYIWAKRNPKLAPEGPKAGWRDRLVSLKVVWAVLILFLVVMGGIYLGVFTPTEAAGVGVFVAFFIALVRGRITKKNIVTSFMNTLSTTGMIFVMIIGAMLFNYVLVLSGLTFALADFVIGLSLPPVGILVAILILYIVLGCLMDAFAMLLILVPILFPVILALGFDPIWFGTVSVIMVEMGLITPPIGLNVFIIAGTARDVPMFDIYRGVTPFIIATALCVAILVIFPQIALFIPNMAR